MRLTASVIIVMMSATCLFPVTAAQADERPRGERGEEHHGPVQRGPAPRFQAHPPGQHPHGPMVRPHPTRVLAPRIVVRGGERHWRHWEHPEFARPVYYWDWALIHNVTCTAEDSYGDQYPVTEAAGPGFGPINMTSVEDEALDRCYSESGGDNSCFLLTCAHY